METSHSSRKWSASAICTRTPSARSARRAACCCSFLAGDGKLRDGTGRGCSCTCHMERATAHARTPRRWASGLNRCIKTPRGAQIWPRRKHTALSRRAAGGNTPRSRARRGPRSCRCTRDSRNLTACGPMGDRRSCGDRTPWNSRRTRARRATRRLGRLAQVRPGTCRGGDRPPWMRGAEGTPRAGGAGMTGRMGGAVGLQGMGAVIVTRTAPKAACAPEATRRTAARHAMRAGISLVRRLFLHLAAVPRRVCQSDRGRRGWEWMRGREHAVAKSSRLLSAMQLGAEQDTGQRRDTALWRVNEHEHKSRWRVSGQGSQDACRREPPSSPLPFPSASSRRARHEAAAGQGGRASKHDAGSVGGGSERYGARALPVCRVLPCCWFRLR